LTSVSEECSGRRQTTAYEDRTGNVLNIAADVAAMGDVAELVSGIDRHLMTACFVFGTLLLQVFVPYHRYVFFLKWLTLSLLAYAAVLFTVHVPWHEVALRTIWPRLASCAGSAGTHGVACSIRT
jgi:Mn2+/Fe2+ NRAMP family transporter